MHFSKTFSRTNSITETGLPITPARRTEIDRRLSMLSQRAEAAKIRRPPPEPATVFIGHGHSSAWRDLKAHLDEQLGYRVEAYETGARAGHTIRDILESMPSKSSFAMLVITAEDKWQEGTSRTREKVIHDVGLFQGRLGFDRALVAIENGVEPFSHLQGIHQLQFRRGNIREIYGEVLATLRREFSDG
jgi:predicted nucleotide-binding protein